MKDAQNLKKTTRKATGKSPGKSAAPGSSSKKSGPASEAAAPAKKAPAKAKTASKDSDIPEVLLEGDESAAAAAARSGPGSRYALSRAAGEGPGAQGGVEGTLPESYGTKRLLLAARDPHWLYAHWDLTRDQQRRYNGLSSDGHLILRIYKDEVGAAPAGEIHVHPESRNWFVHVGLAGSKYLGVLGYYQKSGQWVEVSRSDATVTPADTVSEDTSFWIETLPAEMRFDHLVRLVKTVVKENVPLIEAIQQLRAGGYSGLPTPQAISRGQWTKAQEDALAQLISMDSVRRVWIGSLEITELVRRQWQQDTGSMAASQFSLPSSWSGAVSSFSSPFGGHARGEKSFWFNVNAELIIYGATEPDAEVTIAGRRIKLRPDGSFSYRFSLPDGRYELPAVATSADRTDRRTAALRFERDTRYKGDVGRHPQDPSLKPPRPESVA